MTDLAGAARRAAARELLRDGLAAALAARLETLGAPAESLAAARRIADPGTVVVVAGQQPVLLGGPALVWAKACDALAVARTIEEEHGAASVAVFWNASEDHDHAECDHVRADVGGEIEQLRVTLPGDRRMLSRVPVPADARPLLDLLRERLPPARSRDEVLAAAEPAAGDTMGSWFSRILLRALGPRGLVVVEPETLRPFAARVAETEVRRPGELAAAIRRAEDDAVRRGEPKALELARDELFFLVDEAGRRLRVVRDRASWRVEDGRVLSAAELEALPASAFSWNVAARVLAQDVALPVAAQVCGPSEIRYCERLASCHAMLGVPAPALVRRSEWLFVTSRAARLCRELGVDPERVASGEASGPSPVAPPPAEIAALRDLVARLPSQGSAAVQRRHAGLVQGIDAYAEALARDASDRVTVSSERMRKAAAMLRPLGEPQDRRVSPLPWFAKTGLDGFGAADRGYRAGARHVFHVDERSGAAT